MSTMTLQEVSNYISIDKGNSPDVMLLKFDASTANTINTYNPCCTTIESDLIYGVSPEVFSYGFDVYCAENIIALNIESWGEIAAESKVQVFLVKDEYFNGVSSRLNNVSDPSKLTLDELVDFVSEYPNVYNNAIMELNARLASIKHHLE